MPQSTKKKPATKGRKFVGMRRCFSDPKIHPYDQVEWVKRDVVQHNHKTGEVIFEQKDVEVPAHWSDTSVMIAVTKYFRGTVGRANREISVKQLIDRVVNTYVDHSKKGEYLSEAKAKIFADELRYLLVNQYFAFNSPVWFNVGAPGQKNVISACFILSVDDTMDSILNWYKEEGTIFKGGSGAGVNVSSLRGSNEALSTGGTASGPISFMRGADASAGAIKSGGASRRAAKMVVMNVDHPDIEEFVGLKSHEEKKIKALRDAGFDMDLDGSDITSVQYQNANNSVRVSDQFMQAVLNDESFDLKNRKDFHDGEVAKTVKARDLFTKIAEAAWDCADPGLQYDDTINNWHTCPSSGRINASNPCSEYMHVDNSSCNLASLNLMKFLAEDGTFKVKEFCDAIEVIVLAMDISVDFGHFPTKKVGDNTRKFRQLGIGFANLGALLMSMGLAYDSDSGRAVASAITALMSGKAYQRSADIAVIKGCYDGLLEGDNAASHRRVMEMHRNDCLTLRDTLNITSPEVNDDDSLWFWHTNGCSRAARKIAMEISAKAEACWEDVASRVSWRNSQISVLAPTGTIGFLMGCDTTGIEPDFSLVKFKKMVGGGSMQIVNNSVKLALRNPRFGYTDADIEAIEAHIFEHGDVDGIDEDLMPLEVKEIFRCAVGPKAISADGHIKMMAVCQPFLSGAISKTVNLPHTATVSEIEDIHMRAWKLGLKAIAVYRDGCKVGQPLSSGKSSTESGASEAQSVEDLKRKIAVLEEAQNNRREKMPRERDGKITKFSVQGMEGYMTVGHYDDLTPTGKKRPGEIFMHLGKQGSTMAGIADAFSVSLSIGLQYGVPLEAYVRKFVGTRFEPEGMTSDPQLRMATSFIDYVFRRLAIDYLDKGVREGLNVLTSEEREAAIESTSHGESTAPGRSEPLKVMTMDGSSGKICDVCGSSMQRSGACFACPNCGATSGCS